MASEPAPASSGAEQNFGASQTSEGEESLSPLEQEVLDEYARLLGNLNNVSISVSVAIQTPRTYLSSHLSLLRHLPSPAIPSKPLHPPPNLQTSSLTPTKLSSLLLTLSNNPSAAILDGLRGLERKTSLVFTLLKASVYSIVLNQQIDTEGGDGEGEGETGGLMEDE